MDMDVRDIPKDTVASLPEHFRAAGFEVHVTRKANTRFPEVMTTFVSCRRGKDAQVVFWHEEPDERNWRVYIRCAWGWRAATRARRRRLQADVTAVFEAAGGYFPAR